MPIRFIKDVVLLGPGSRREQKPEREYKTDQVVEGLSRDSEQHFIKRGQAVACEPCAPAEPDDPPSEAPAEASAGGREAVHKGRGVWAVVDGSGEEIATGLTKEQAGEMVAQS